MDTLACIIQEKVKLFSRVRLFVTPWTVAHQAPPSVGFSRQEYWSALLFPSPGDLSNPGIEPRSPALQADALTSEPPGKPKESRVLNYKGLYKWRKRKLGEGVCQGDAMWQDLTSHCWLWRRKGAGAKECGQPLKARKGKAKDSLLKQLERKAALQTPWLEPTETWVRNTELQNNTLVLLQVTKFVVICYSSNRLIHRVPNFQATDPTNSTNSLFLRQPNHLGFRKYPGIKTNLQKTLISVITQDPPSFCPQKLALLLYPASFFYYSPMSKRCYHHRLLNQWGIWGWECVSQVSAGAAPDPLAHQEPIPATATGWGRLSLA